MIQKIIGSIIAFLPLLFGGLIYICFRDENIFFFSWFKILNIDYSFLRQVNIGNNIISTYIIYNLPHGLWVLSGLLFLKLFLEKENRICLFYSTIFIGIAISLEILQYFGIRRGTFDIFDLITIIIFSSIGLSISIIGEKYEKN
jgi:hypothetical protein